jgi:MFS family permease
MKERILGLPRNIFLLGLTSLFNDFSSEMVYAVFPAFFTAVLGAGAGALGIVDGIAEAASNFFKIYSGALSDTSQQRKRFVLWGYSLSVLTRPFYALVSTVTGALGLRFLDRVGKGLRDAPRDAIISLSTARAELGRSFGYHRAMDTIGAVLGPLTAYVILLYFPLHFDTVFLTAFFIGIVSVATILFIHDVAAESAPHGGVLAAFQGLSADFKLYLFAVLILSAGSLPVAVMLLKTEAAGLLIADIPLFYMVYNLSYAAFSYGAGALSDRIGARRMIPAGYAALLAGYAVVASAHSTLPLFLGFFILGLFPAMTDGVQRALASQLSAEGARGGALGWLNAAAGFGALIAGIAGGFVWQHYGPTAALSAAGGVILLGLLVFAGSMPKRAS